MPTVGEQLRAAREAQKLRIQDVADATNMRADHIAALEEGNHAPFPAPIYIRGSVRTYARLLKLDVPAIMTALNAEMSRTDETPHTGTHAGHRRTVLDYLALQLAQFGWKRSLMVLAALGLVLLIWAWRLGRSKPAEDPLSNLPPPMYQPSTSTQSGYLPLPNQQR